MFDVMKNLYKNEVKLNLETVGHILEHKDEYREKLEGILDNAKEQYIRYEKHPEQADISYYHVIHSSLLLAEMESETSLDIVLEFLSNDYDILEFWLGDTFTEEYWYVIWKLGKNNLEKLFDFLNSVEKNTVAKAVVGMGITKIYLSHKKSREKIIAEYKKTLYNDNLTEDQKAFIIADIIEMGLDNFTNEVEEVFPTIEKKQSVIYRSEIKNPIKMRGELYMADTLEKIYTAIHDRTLTEDILFGDFI